MGKEATCVVRLDGSESTCKVKLETDFLQLSGDIKLKTPLSALSSVETNEGWLDLMWPDHKLLIQLGPEADRWAKAILEPPSLLDKLGLKPGLSVALLQCKDPSFMNGQPFCTSLPEQPVDAILFFAENMDRLQEATLAAANMAPKGMLWIVYPRGNKAITEMQVLEFGRSLGLTDTKVCRFSDTQTALKFVHRRA